MNFEVEKIRKNKEVKSRKKKEFMDKIKKKPRKTIVV